MVQIIWVFFNYIITSHEWQPARQKSLISGIHSHGDNSLVVSAKVADVLVFRQGHVPEHRDPSFQSSVLSSPFGNNVFFSDLMISFSLVLACTACPLFCVKWMRSTPYLLGADVMDWMNKMDVSQFQTVKGCRFDDCNKELLKIFNIKSIILL